MRPRSRVQHELHDRQKLSPLRRVAPHNIGDQQPEQLLQLLMAPLHDALLHGPPGCSECLPAAKQRKEFLHQRILELRTSIAPHNRGQGPRPEDASCKRSSDLRCRKRRGRFKQGRMRQAANIREHVPVASSVRRRTWALEVDHDFLPTFKIHGPDCHRILLRWPFAKANARRTASDPLLDLLGSLGPPGDTKKDPQRLRQQTVPAEDAHMDLQEHPSAPCQVPDVSFRHHGDPGLHAGALFHKPLFHQAISRRTTERDVPAACQLLELTALRQQPLPPQGLLDGEAAFARFRPHFLSKSFALLNLPLEPLFGHRLEANLAAFAVRERRLPRNLRSAEPTELSASGGVAHRRAHLLRRQARAFGAA